MILRVWGVSSRLAKHSKQSAAVAGEAMGTELLELLAETHPGASSVRAGTNTCGLDT